MTSITGSLYTTLNTQPGLSTLAGADSGTSSESAVDTAVATQETVTDTVSLSSGVTTAKAREYLGLAPTGKLTLADFQDAARNQEAIVEEALAAARNALGIPADQQISLSLDGDGTIAVAEDFSGKEALEDYLNEDEGFIKAFAGLSSNSEVMAYARSLTTSSSSLADYLGGTGSGTDLMSIGRQYATLKSSRSIETLWQISHSKTPFSYTHGNGEEAV